MATGGETRISTQYHQLKAGGDIAAIMGMCKYAIEHDDAGEAVLDHDFIAEHCHGYDAFAAHVRETGWNAIEKQSGLPRAAIETAARTYCNAKAVIGVYGMGLTQHRYGIDNVRMLMNLLLLRGNIGRPGAGPGPVRGHSNVQGQRTVGITEKPELAPLDKLKEQFGFEPPRTKGWDTVESCRAVLDGRASAFVGLGGNFLRAVPEHGPMEAAWRDLGLTVHIATKLNRSHLFPGKECWLLPCLGRMEADAQATGAQAVTIEDSFSHIHGSLGKATPASPHLLSEPAIVAEIAKATLAPNPKVPWDDWVGDYGKVRDAIGETYPEMFGDYNARLFTPGGFWKGNAASHRIWKTKSGKAEFFVPRSLNASGVEDAPDRFRLMTVRSNDQFNTTVYGYDDRFRGISGTRMIVMMNRKDMARLGVRDGEMVTLESDAEDNHHRSISGLRVVPYNVPDQCLAGYFPELNVLIPLEHHALDSHVPAGKSVPVRVRRG